MLRLRRLEHLAKILELRPAHRFTRGKDVHGRRTADLIITKSCCRFRGAGRKGKA